jgi:glycosyltransferase involved in cell wall biosynthesis
MPVFNEVSTVKTVVQSVLAQPVVAEVLVIDDGSSDGTAEVLAQFASHDSRLKLFRHEKNCGKGAALRTAFAHANAPIVLVQDADLEYDPAEYGALISPILAGRADVVLGSRFQGTGPHRVLYFWHFIGNKLLTTFSNICTNLNITDMEAGYKIFRREIIKQIQVQENRFGFEPEIIAKVSRIKGIRIYEVPISYYGRTYAEGKKVSWRDGISALRCIIKYNFFSRD